MEDTQPDQMSVSEWAKVWVLVSLVILGLILLTSTWKYVHYSRDLKTR